MTKIGRPRLYATRAERDKAYRKAKAAAGYKNVNIEIPYDDWKELKRFCKETGQKLPEAVPFLVDYYFEEERRKQEERQKP